MAAEKAVRSHETRAVIDAPIEDVWKALTEARALARWFAPKMTVEPGVGGFVLADWGPGLEWKTTIEIWEPNRRLRLAETRDRVMSSSPVDEPLEPCRLVEDFYLEAEGGKSVLRLVHSGFGSSEPWDSEYEGTRAGWATCFLRLRHGLERHCNEPTQNLIVTRLCYGVPSGQALARIESVAPQPLEIAFRGGSHLCFLLPERNGSIFTVSVQPSPIGSVAYVEILLFARPDAEAAALESEWRAKLAQLFPDGPTP
ncbi:MAG: SRPBCC domain-containing protein [Candidatus Solibacter usitatus]|nr:SRPBCC domain-containing protein [Candidatus Solibacter usitatus]